MSRVSILALIAVVAMLGLSCEASKLSVSLPMASEKGSVDSERPDQDTTEEAGPAEPALLNTIVGSGIDPDAFPLTRMMFGGVPKDGIPALTDPKFVVASEADYLSDTDLVLGVYINGEARAYPHNILWWHEIVNDQVGGKHISVTYCPLTGTGLVFDLDAVGVGFTLGVSGLLYNNNLIMYDRRDGESLYPQMYFTGVSGTYKGTELALLPVVETTWGMWKKMHPSTTAVSENTGYLKDYRRYPYGDYETNDETIIFPLTRTLDTRFGAKDKVLGLLIGDVRRAYPFSTTHERMAVNDEVDGRPILILIDPTSRTAIPYEREVNGLVLRFAVEPGGTPLEIKDEETGTIWNIKGEATRGPLAGSRLAQIPAHNAFWFAWAAFWPDTEVWHP